jgi:hypothetical protein
MSKENRKFGIGLCANSAFCNIPQSTQEKTKSVHHDAHYVQSASNSRILEFNCAWRATFTCIMSGMLIKDKHKTYNQMRYILQRHFTSTNHLQNKGFEYPSEKLDGMLQM